jgi:Family of unknown function (DUF6350)
MSALLERTRARLSAGLSARLSAGLSSGQVADDPRRLATTAPVAACWALGVGLALCVGVAAAGWLAGSAGDAADGVRVGVQVWLLAHGTGVQVGSTAVTALPLGLTVLSATLLWRAGRWASATTGVADLRAAGSGAAMMSAVYATGAAAAALLSATGASAVSPVRAFLVALLLAAVFSLLGILHGSGLLRDIWALLPAYARDALRGGAAAVLSVLAAGTLTVTAALVLGFGDAANLARASGAGVVGGAILTAAGVLLMPNATLLAVSYLLGPGFTFGSGTTVAPSGVVLGRVPAFPLLAALPDQGAAPVWTMGLLAVPLLAGVLGAVVALRGSGVTGLDQAALRGGLAGFAGGLVTGALTALGGGAVGPGRMADVGADVLACTATAAAAMALAGGLGGLVLGWRMRR